MNGILSPLLAVGRKCVSPFDYDIVKKQALVDVYLHDYGSYEEYRDVQVFYNKKKIGNVWADEGTLDRVAALVQPEAGDRKASGICHGTRNGFEQNYLNSNYPGIEAIGTDISDTATDFENSVQWDFHDENPEWLGAYDFVYSNSLDQSWKPKLALTTWLNQVRTGGVVIIEHTEDHGPMGASEMDPFGVRPIAMPYVLSDWFGHQISISHSKADKRNMDREAWLFVCRKLVDTVN